MHYSDEQQLREAELEIVVYKHGTSGEVRRNKNGILSKRSVHYEIASIRKCQKIAPFVLNKILSDPYKYLSKELDFLPFEEWILVSITDINGYGKVKVKSITIVSKHPDDSMRLH